MKNFYLYFLKNYKSEGYNNYLDNKKRQSVNDSITKNQQKFLESNPNIWCFKIFDVLDNKQFSKLIKKIYGLNKKSFSVHCSYKKNSLFKKYNYIRIKFGLSQYGSVAKIELKRDEFIDNIDILWSPIDDWRGFVEYTFNLKKSISATTYERFLETNLINITNKDCKIKFKIVDLETNYADFDFIRRNSLNIIFQHYITSLLFTEEGKKEFLPSMSFKNFDKEYEFKDFKNRFFCETFINLKENYAIEKRVISDNYHYNLFCSKNCRPNIHVSKYIFDYGIPFYYLFFGEFEINKVRNLLSSSKIPIKGVPAKKVIYLFNLMESSKLERKNIRITDEIDNWIYLYGSNDPKKIYEKNNYDYKNIYDVYYHYFRDMLDINNLVKTKWLSIIAIIVAVVGIVSSIVLGLLSLLCY